MLFCTTIYSSVRVWSPQKIQSAVETREVTDLQASPNIEVWLTQIGFSFGFEFYKEGFRYMAIYEHNGKVSNIHIYVYKLKKVAERANFHTSSDVAPGYMVEFQVEEDPQHAKEFGVRLLNFARGFSSFLTLSEHANAR